MTIFGIYFPDVLDEEFPRRARWNFIFIFGIWNFFFFWLKLHAILRCAAVFLKANLEFRCIERFIYTLASFVLRMFLCIYTCPSLLLYAIPFSVKWSLGFFILPIFPLYPLFMHYHCSQWFRLTLFCYTCLYFLNEFLVGNNYTCSMSIIFFVFLTFNLHSCFYPNINPPPIPPHIYLPHALRPWDDAVFFYFLFNVDLQYLQY